MSVASRLLGGACRSAVPRLLWGRNDALSERPGPRRVTTDRAQLAFCASPGRSLASAAGGSACWKCGQAGREARFFCKACSALQKPDQSYNYFQLLGVSETFDINASELSKKFRQLQAVLHPDKFSNASDNEKNFSGDLSSLVNKAFRTLSNPLERGLYLLGLHGSPILEENTSFNKAFLFEIMELNEELESIVDRNELKIFHQKNTDVLISIQKNISELFLAREIPKARTALMEMKYYVTLEEKIKEKLLLLEARN